jgi:hypothetical protein
VKASAASERSDVQLSVRQHYGVGVAASAVIVSRTIVLIAEKVAFMCGGIAVIVIPVVRNTSIVFRSNSVGCVDTTNATIKHAAITVTMLAIKKGFGMS